MSTAASTNDKITKAPSAAPTDPAKKTAKEIAAVRARCEDVFGVGNGSGASACTCGWLDDGVGPSKPGKKTFLCSGDVPCKRTDPNDGKGSGCTFSKKAIDAATAKDALIEGGYICAEEVRQKYTGGWTCYPDGLTCVQK